MSKIAVLFNGKWPDFPTGLARACHSAEECWLALAQDYTQIAWPEG